MAKKITQLPSMAATGEFNGLADVDLTLVVDRDHDETKNITIAELIKYINVNGAMLNVGNTTSPVVVSHFSTISRDMIENPQLGSIIYNTDTDSFQGYKTTGWTTL